MVVKTCPGFSTDGDGGKPLPLLAVGNFASAGNFDISLAASGTRI
jgi:hypothetical protein